MCTTCIHVSQLELLGAHTPRAHGQAAASGSERLQAGGQQFRHAHSKEHGIVSGCG